MQGGKVAEIPEVLKYQARGPSRQAVNPACYDFLSVCSQPTLV